MNEFRETFRKTVESLIVGIQVPAKLDLSEEKDILYIPKQNPNGFDLTLVCFDYGVYPYSTGGWHSGCWDVTIFEPKVLAESLTEFISSVLEDAVMNVSYSNEKPYKWKLHHRFDGEKIYNETGLLFFNWFGKRSHKSYCNGKTAT